MTRLQRHHVTLIVITTTITASQPTTRVSLFWTTRSLNSIWTYQSIVNYSYPTWYARYWKPAYSSILTQTRFYGVDLLWSDDYKSDKLQQAISMDNLVSKITLRRLKLLEGWMPAPGNFNIDWAEFSHLLRCPGEHSFTLEWSIDWLSFMSLIRNQSEIASAQSLRSVKASSISDWEHGVQCCLDLCRRRTVGGSRRMFDESPDGRRVALSKLGYCSVKTKLLFITEI